MRCPICNDWTMSSKDIHDFEERVALWIAKFGASTYEELNFQRKAVEAALRCPVEIWP